MERGANKEERLPYRDRTARPYLDSSAPPDSDEEAAARLGSSCDVMSLISSYMADTTRVVRIALSRRVLAMAEMILDEDVDDFIFQIVAR